MKAKAFTGVLLTLALLASSAAVARAGGGGSGGSDPLGMVFLTDCYKVDDGGSNPPFTMELTDQFGNRQNIKVGQAQLLCVPSGPWARQPGSGSPELNPNFDPTAINAFKCYDVVSPGDHGPGSAGMVTDLFTTQRTVLKRLTTLCVPAVRVP